MAAPSGSPKGGVKELVCSAGAVFMAAVFCFFYVGIVRWAALIFLRSFYYFIFLDLFQVGYQQLKQTAVFIFLSYVFLHFSN